MLAFALLFGAGGGMQTLLSGTLPAALFGPASYGAVVGVLHACTTAPARSARSAPGSRSRWRATSSSRG